MVEGVINCALAFFLSLFVMKIMHEYGEVYLCKDDQVKFSISNDRFMYLTNCMEHRASLRSQQSSHLAKEFPALYGTQSFVTVLTWGPPLVLVVSDESSPHAPVIFIIHFNIFLSPI
jgi:hypothetical protein